LISELLYVDIFIPVTRRAKGYTRFVGKYVKGYTRFVGKYVTGRRKRFRVGKYVTGRRKRFRITSESI